MYKKKKTWTKMSCHVFWEDLQASSRSKRKADRQDVLTIIGETEIRLTFNFSQ